MKPVLDNHLPCKADLLAGYDDGSVASSRRVSGGCAATDTFLKTSFVPPLLWEHGARRTLESRHVTGHVIVSIDFHNNKRWDLYVWCLTTFAG